MRTLGLPGKNKSTGPWLDKILSSEVFVNDVIQRQSYRAWQSTEEEIDEVFELDVASKFEPELIVAKSMGSILTILGVAQSILKPQACVFMGVPILSLQKDEKSCLENWKDTGIKTLFIQQHSDPTGSFSQLLELIRPADNLCFEVVEGSDHIYSDIPELVGLMKSWRNRMNSW